LISSIEDLLCRLIRGLWLRRAGLACSRTRGRNKEEWGGIKWSGNHSKQFPSDIVELSNRKRGESLEGSKGEINRAGVLAGRAGVFHGDIDGLALPGNPDLLTAVLGLGASVSIDTVVEGSNEVIIRVLLATSAKVAVLSEPGDVSAGVGLGRRVRSGSWGRLGSGGSGGGFDGLGGGGGGLDGLGGGGGGDGSRSGSVRGNRGGRRRGFVVAVLVVIIVAVVSVVTIVLTIITVVVRNGSRPRSWRTGGGRLNTQGVGRGLGHGCRGGRRSRTRPRATVSLAIVLEGFTLLHGMATIVEELGVVLLLAANSKVTSVVVVVWLENFGNPTGRRGRTGDDGGGVDGGEGSEGDESKRE
jgi:hypothetical protein